MPIPFVGKRFSLAEFAAYLAKVRLDSFQPEMVVLHHTGRPSLAQRPHGFESSHIANLRHYYEAVRGWSGAPHLFVDDQPRPIVVFQRLDRPGVHSPSFNACSWAIEMLGNYDVESPDEGRGALVLAHAAAAAAMLLRRIGADEAAVRLHRDDPRARKSCPGRLISCSKIVGWIAASLRSQ